MFSSFFLIFSVIACSFSTIFVDSESESIPPSISPCPISLSSPHSIRPCTYIPPHLPPLSTFAYPANLSFAGVGLAPEQMRIFYTSGSSDRRDSNGQLMSPYGEYIFTWITNGTRSSRVHIGASPDISRMQVYDASDISVSSSEREEGNFLYTELYCNTKRNVHTVRVNVEEIAKQVTIERETFTRENYRVKKTKSNSNNADDDDNNKNNDNADDIKNNTKTYTGDFAYIYYQLESDGFYSSIYRFHALMHEFKHHSTTITELDLRPPPSSSSSSSSLSTTTATTDARPFRVAIFGDFGFDNELNVFSVLFEYAHSSHLIDTVLHIGDMGYDLPDYCNGIADAFFQPLSYLSTSVPYFIGIGNHEQDAYFTYNTYVNRVQRPQTLLSTLSDSPNTAYYSIDIDGIHYVSLDTDSWLFVTRMNDVPTQYKWLEQDLKRVDRRKTPWIVVGGHRLPYCTKSKDDECNGECLVLRNGLFGGLFFGIEHLLWTYGVDLYIGGHTHHTEVTYPVYDGVETQRDFKFPKATAYLQIGMAGVLRGAGDRFEVPQQTWEQWRDEELHSHFALLTVYNETHLGVDVVDGIENRVSDAFVIEQHPEHDFHRYYPGHHRPNHIKKHI